jgi:hypothetical protein
MPYNASLARTLIEKYGRKKAMEIYHAMENDGKESFKKGLETAIKEKHTTKTFPRGKRKKKK